MISDGRCEVAIDPDLGGRIAQIRFDGNSILIGREATTDPAFGWGSFPMVPWAGRVRRGRFEFDGVEYQLPINFETHAIHGLAYDRVWEVVDQGEDSIELSVAFDPRWPFGGTAFQRITVSDDGEVAKVDMTLGVIAGDKPMPAALGWHPWFIKPETFRFEPTAQFERDQEWITTADTTPPRPRPWDDTFFNSKPVVLGYRDRTITVASPLQVWVVFDMPADATCVEPQTAPPDGFTIAPNRLEPGETLEAEASISISA